MALTTQGFGLRALPESPHIPANIGKVDVPGLYDNVVKALQTHEAVASSATRQMATQNQNILASQKAATESGLLGPEAEARVAEANRKTALASPAIVQGEANLALAENANKQRREDFLKGVDVDDKGAVSHIEEVETRNADGTSTIKRVRKFQKVGGGTAPGGSETKQAPTNKPPVYENTTFEPVAGAPGLFASKTTAGTTPGASDLGAKSVPYRAPVQRALTPAQSIVQAQTGVEEARRALAVAAAGTDEGEKVGAKAALDEAIAFRDERIATNTATKVAGSPFLTELLMLQNNQSALNANPNNAMAKQAVEFLSAKLASDTAPEGSSKELVNQNALIKFTQLRDAETDPGAKALYENAVNTFTALMKKAAQGKTDPMLDRLTQEAEAAKGGGAPATAPVRVMTQAAYDALPHQTHYTDSLGRPAFKK